MKITTYLEDIFAAEKDNLWLWAPLLFAFGAVFSITFTENFLAKILIFTSLFFAATLLAFLNRYSTRALLFMASAIFIAGSFYAILYQKTILNHSEITGKLYVDGIGKVESIRRFYNPITKKEGLSVLISSPDLYRAEFKSKNTEVKKVKKRKKTKKLKIEKSEKPVKRKSKKQKAEELGLTIEEFEEKISLEKAKKAEEKLKKAAEKLRKKQEKREEKIIKNFINVFGYQDIDRRFLDYSKNYQQVKWVEVNNHKRFPNPPQKILINLVKNFDNIAVNDVIAVRMMLQPLSAKEFPDDFDVKIDAKAKKIGAYGFVIGSPQIVKKSETSRIEDYLRYLREKIRNRIDAFIVGDSGAIALALLIGDQNQISKPLMVNIRNSGLAHLLSISGFHLSLIAAIFFTITRFLLSRSQYLALNFDLKKFAAIAAMLGSYFYLKIADSPLPAQRAFLMVLFVLIALCVGQKVNNKRIIMSAIFFMTLYNPYGLFNIGFQLSFASILMLEASNEIFKNHDQDRNFLVKVFWYFLLIILLSITIQIATMPFLMYSFRNVSMLGFLANILAIPLASFFVMPLGFLSLFLMPFGLEKYALLLMREGILLIEKIANFVGNLDHSYFVSPQLSSVGLIIAIIGLCLICLSSNKLKLIGILTFCLSFVTIYFAKKPDILFDGRQKFFAIYDQKNGLIFSKDIKPSKRRAIWMKELDELEFKSLQNFSKTWQQEQGIICDKVSCVIEKNKKILVLLARNELSKICQNDFDIIVNLNSKYELPSCIKQDKIMINNLDFYNKGGHFFYFQNNELEIKTAK